MEVNTKERILQEALVLFAQNGYMATSMSDIAKKLDITKPALYKHYKSKQEIFDSIVERMNQMDQLRAEKYQMPEGTFQKMAESYNRTPLEKIKIFSEVQFRHWTEEDFSCNFRKMLTLEQYRNEEMNQLYQNYLATGPIQFMTELFAEMLKEKGRKDNPKQVAMDFYGPIFLLISMYDLAGQEKELLQLLKEHIEQFAKRLGFE
ncbi:MAG: TetR/AcrR family transcriptional regulator [Clostridia bacterium]|nr:TetR/AcrR family transcriptional regulator [Clostridia bacterium]